MGHLLAALPPASAEALADKIGGDIIGVMLTSIVLGIGLVLVAMVAAWVQSGIDTHKQRDEGPDA